MPPRSRRRCGRSRATGEALSPARRRTYVRALVAAGIATVLMLAAVFLFGHRPTTDRKCRPPPLRRATSHSPCCRSPICPLRATRSISAKACPMRSSTSWCRSRRCGWSGCALPFYSRVGAKICASSARSSASTNLLDGSIRKDGDRLRVTAQLLRARDGTSLWSKVYERELRDVFAVQEEIARDVAKALPVKLDVGPMSRAQGGTNNLDAYDRYLRWRQLFLAERREVADHRTRAQLLREAVHFDPRFVLAWGELADELDALASSLEDPAVELGARQAASLRGEAGRARERVLALAPESWMALRIRSEQLANQKRWAESIEVARQILDTGPFTLERAYPYINVIAAVGRFDETIELVERVIRIEPLADVCVPRPAMESLGGPSLPGGRGRISAQPRLRGFPYQAGLHRVPAHTRIAACESLGGACSIRTSSGKPHRRRASLVSRPARATPRRSRSRARHDPQGREGSAIALRDALYPRGRGGRTGNSVGVSARPRRRARQSRLQEILGALDHAVLQPAHASRLQGAAARRGHRRLLAQDRQVE